MLILTLIFIIVLTRLNTINCEDYQWPREVEVIENGDVMLGALMMVHERRDQPITCGNLFSQGGLQAVEMMLYTIDYINNNNIMATKTNYRLGVRILDDCDKDTYGLQQSIKFIQACDLNTEHNYGNTTKISGVVAASSSVTSMQVQSLLKLFQLPQVSYFSTSAELEDTSRYDYFFRTIPSDTNQVDVMVALIKYFKWTYVSVVYEESSYGESAFNSLQSKLERNGVCLAYHGKFPKDSSAGCKQLTTYRDIVKGLSTDANMKARVVIIYASDQEVHCFMKAVKEEKQNGNFTWIGSDGWSARADVYQDGLEDTVVGTISVQPLASEVPGFKEYFRNLTVQSNVRNPWFYEFWEEHFKCIYPGKPMTYAKEHSSNEYNYNCTGYENESIKKYQFESQLQFVSDAVMLFAYGLKKMLETTPNDGLAINTTYLRDIMKNITFTSNEFRFLWNDGTKWTNGPPPRYKIIHFKRNNDTNSTKYYWEDIGSFTSDEQLKINISRVEFYTDVDVQRRNNIPTSDCSQKCAPGHTMVVSDVVEKRQCCWQCRICPANTYHMYRERLNEANNTTVVEYDNCTACLNGTKADSEHVKCESIPEETVEMFSIYGMICLLIALIGFVITILILVVFVRYNATPVVRASGRELSYMIICGLLMCFGITVLMLQRPSMIVCGVQRFMSGFCFTVIYAGLLVKTNRIARIFRAGKRTKRRPNCISPESQIALTAALVSVQVIIVAFWMIWKPPKARHDYENDRNVLLCNESDKATYLITYAYPIVLCIACTIYAIQTRNIPEQFNESRHIGAAVYTTCVIWLAFVPIYAVVKQKTQIRVSSVCVATSLTAIVCQVTLFLPKLYIILCQPEKNIRQSVTGKHVVGFRTQSGANVLRTTDSSCESEEGMMQTLKNQNASSKLSICKSVKSIATQTSNCCLSDIPSIDGSTEDEQFIRKRRGSATSQSSTTEKLMTLDDIQL